MNAAFAALLAEYWRGDEAIVLIGGLGLLSVALFSVYCVKSIWASRFWSSEEVKAIFLEDSVQETGPGDPGPV